VDVGLIEMAPACMTLIWMISPYSRIKHAHVETHNNIKLLYFSFVITILTKFLF